MDISIPKPSTIDGAPLIAPGRPGAAKRRAYSEADVKRASEPGRYSAGDGLFLLVGARKADGSPGSKSWAVRLSVDGRRHDIGLGSAAVVTRRMAVEKAKKAREQAAMGLDPRDERRRQRAKPTFEEAARASYAVIAPTLSNAKHRAQWISTLETYVFPRIGTLRVDRVTEADVKAVLAPIWQEKHETARRVRQRISAVMVDAVANGHRSNVLELAVVNKSLGKRSRGVKHHGALPFRDLPTFMPELAAKPGVGALALRFAILTAARSGEVRGATWAEIDTTSAVWTIPADRMKAGKEHVVPLSVGALAVLAQARQHVRSGSDLIFPGSVAAKPISDMTMTKALRDMGYGGTATAHGFRSSFRDWAAEETRYPGDVAEAALAHTVPDAVVAAYRRTDFFAKRKSMMADWSAWCLDRPDNGDAMTPESSNVVKIGAAHG